MIISTRPSGGKALHKSSLAAATLGVTALVCAAPAFAQQGSFPDVPENHWAYQAVNNLASKGYVLGYPDGRFLGKRTLTRYEFAMVINRIVEKMSQPATPTAPPPASGLSDADAAEIKRLIDTFKVELATIGTDLTAIKAVLDEHEQRITDLENALKDARELGESNLKAINVINTKRIDGYIQARYTRRLTDSSTDAPEANPSGTAGYTDVNRGYNGNVDTFHVRRARVNIRGDVTPNASYRIQLDARTANAPGAQETTIKEAYVVAKNFPVPASNKAKPFITTDLWAGQSVTPFGYILFFSSSDRYSPERYLAFSDIGTGLLPNQDYEKGVALVGAIQNKYRFHAGVYNGTGTASNDPGRRKDFIGKIDVTLTPRWNIGIAGYDGEGYNTGTTFVAGGTSPAAPIGGVPSVFNQRRRVKSLFDANTQFLIGPFETKLEYVRGKGGLSGTTAGPTVPVAMQPFVDAATVEGGYGEVALGFGAKVAKIDIARDVDLQKFKLVGAYEFFYRNADPQDNGRFSNYLGRDWSKKDFLEERLHAGLLYYPDRSLRFRLWYEHPLDYPNLPGQGNFLKKVDLLTAEIQVKF